MKVYVIGLNGIGLMPTTPGKARKLLKAGKAEVYQKHPFSIRLLYKTGCNTQPVSLGIDTGESHIGIAAVSQGRVLEKSDLQLRSSMEKRKLMERRKEYRRGRRYRKVRYRHPKFRFHTKRVYSSLPDKKGRHWGKVNNQVTSARTEGWLPPSIESKVQHHIIWIRKYLAVLPPDTGLAIETARFDIQRMKDPNIHGELYQRGRLYDHENMKSYVLAKFDYTCPVCKHKFDKEHKPRMHHITYRSKGATDNPDEYAPVCEKCHDAHAHEKGQALDKLRKACKRKEYREPTFMNILRRRLFRAFPDAGVTYGNVTNADREALGLEKTHANDAAAVAAHGWDSVINSSDTVYYRQVRRKKRSLHEATPRKGRRTPNRTARRNVKNIPYVGNFHVYDKVEFNGKKAYISGFTGKAAYIIDFGGKYITEPGKTYKQVSLSKLKILSIRSNNYIVTAG